MIFDLASPQVTTFYKRNNQPSNQQLSEDLFFGDEQSNTIWINLYKRNNDRTLTKVYHSLKLVDNKRITQKHTYQQPLEKIWFHFILLVYQVWSFPCRSTSYHDGFSFFNPMCLSFFFCNSNYLCLRRYSLIEQYRVR